jgi:hypothetical protein
MSFLENVGVIIRQLFARFHIAYRLDPDPPVVYDGVAVRIARVVDEAGIVAVHRCIDDDVIVDGEEVCVMPPLSSSGYRASASFGVSRSPAYSISLVPFGIVCVANAPNPWILDRLISNISQRRNYGKPRFGHGFNGLNGFTRMPTTAELI